MKVDSLTLVGRYFVGDFGPGHYIHVYAIAPKGGGTVKFGRALDVKKRFSSIQTGSPVKLEILGSVFVPTAVETEIHGYLKDHQSHGEWFLPTVRVMEIANFIAVGDAHGLVKQLGLYKLLPQAEAEQSNFEHRMATGPRRL